MDWTKLDSYDYSLHPGIISIRLAGTNDPDLVDIMSEIDRSNGRIYIDGQRFLYLDDYRILSKGTDSSIELYVRKL